MDQTLLVDRELQDVPRLIEELRKDNFIPKAAFWLFTSEADEWNLCLVMDGIKEHGSSKEYLTLVKAMRRMDDLWIDPFALKLIDSTEPLAKAVLDQLARRQEREAKIPIRLRKSNLGGVFADAAYIYPNAAVAGACSF
jgi:hypothetical protein